MPYKRRCSTSDPNMYGNSKRYRIHNIGMSMDDSDSDFESPVPRRNFFNMMGNSGVYRKGIHIYFITGFNKNSITRLIDLMCEASEDIRQNAKQYEQPLENYHISLHITSPGGCVFSAFRAIDWIKSSGIPVYTYVHGQAASAGALLATVGTRRFIGKYSYMLIHDISSGMQGNMHNIVDDFENNKELNKRCREILLKHTDLQENTGTTKNKSKDYTVNKPVINDIDEAMSHDLWWDAESCLKAGLVDKIYN